MSELPHGSGAAGSGALLDDPIAQNALPDPTPQYRAYRPTEFTPPASPGYNASPTLSATGTFGQNRSPITQPYEREVYTPSPSASPTLHPALPPPHFPVRQDLSSRHRHGALPSPLNGGFPRAEQPASPTMRQFSGPTLPNDPRAIYNPLASNPVNPGRTWRDSRDELGLGIRPRARGQTTSVSTASGHHPTLRSATSIPDYTPIRTMNRGHPSGTYRPDRGPTNWSQNDNYPLSMRQWPVPGSDEARASFRSGWTTTSSAFQETSGTERSSVLTKRSSISENRLSIESKIHSEPPTSQEEHGPQLENTLSNSMESDAYNEDYDDVMDTIAMYEYDDEEEEVEDVRRLETQEIGSDEGYVSQTTTGTSLNSSDQSRETSSSVSPALSRDSTRLSAIEQSPHDATPSPQNPRHEQSQPTAMKDSLSVKHNLARMSRKVSLSSAASIIKPLPDTAVSARPRRNSNSIVERQSKLLLSAPKPLAKASTFDILTEQTGKRRSSQTLINSPITIKSVNSPTTPVKSSPSLQPIDIPRDRYGFKKVTKEITVEQYDEWNVKYQEHVARRTKKWEALMRKHALPTDNPVQFPPRSERVKRYIRKGIPPEWRGAAWFFYSNGPEMMAGEMKDVYWRLVGQCKAGQLSENDRDLIDRDLHRTFPDNIAFKPDPTSQQPTAPSDPGSEEEAPIIHALRRVLQAFALNNPSIGYCQSLNFIAGLLLLFLSQDEEKAFIMLTIITQEHLPGTHAKNLLNVDIGVLMMLIREQLPPIWAAIDDIQALNSGPGSNAHPHSNASRLPTVSLATTSWFMSLFLGNLPIETVLRVWDQFLYEGSRVLFRVALAIFRTGETEIRACTGPDMMEVFQVVQTLPRKCLDPNALIDRVYSGRTLFNTLSQANIEQRRAWWKELLTNDRLGKENQNHTPPIPDTERPSLRRKTSRRFKQSFKLAR